MPVGMRIGKSIVFEVENQKMKVKTLKKIRFHINMDHMNLNWSMVVKLIQKKSTSNFDKTLQ